MTLTSLPGNIFVASIRASASICYRSHVRGHASVCLLECARFLDVCQPSSTATSPRLSCTAKKHPCARVKAGVAYFLFLGFAAVAVVFWVIGPAERFVRVNDCSSGSEWVRFAGCYGR